MTGGAAGAWAPTLCDHMRTAFHPQAAALPPHTRLMRVALTQPTFCKYHVYEASAGAGRVAGWRGGGPTSELPSPTAAWGATIAYHDSRHSAPLAGDSTVATAHASSRRASHAAGAGARAQPQPIGPL
jgi:hypothetical protein